MIRYEKTFIRYCHRYIIVVVIVVVVVVVVFCCSSRYRLCLAQAMLATMSSTDLQASPHQVSISVTYGGEHKPSSLSLSLSLPFCEFGKKIMSVSTFGSPLSSPSLSSPRSSPT